MGNYRFRLSTMIPNAWFYKLKDMSRASRSHRIQNSQKRSHPQRSTSSSTTEQFYLPKRTSYYFPSRERAEQPPNSPINTKTSDTHFPNDPLKKPKQKNKNNPINPKVDFNGVELGLPPILTKPTKNSAKRSQLYGDPNENWKRISCKDGNFIEKSPARIVHRVKIRAISPVIAGKKRSIAKQRNGLKESFAIVKMSSDPKRDFRDSMMEMIVENDIRGSKGLEELLACYLALNSKEYHEVIVDVFKEIWFGLTRI